MSPPPAMSLYDELSRDSPSTSSLLNNSINQLSTSNSPSFNSFKKPFPISKQITPRKIIRNITRVTTLFLCVTNIQPSADIEPSPRTMIKNFTMTTPELKQQRTLDASLLFPKTAVSPMVSTSPIRVTQWVMPILIFRL
jgi:hypothetical protein